MQPATAAWSARFAMGVTRPTSIKERTREAGQPQRPTFTMCRTQRCRTRLIRLRLSRLALLPPSAPVQMSITLALPHRLRDGPSSVHSTQYTVHSKRSGGNGLASGCRALILPMVDSSSSLGIECPQRLSGTRSRQMVSVSGTTSRCCFQAFHLCHARLVGEPKLPSW